METRLTYDMTLEEFLARNPAPKDPGGPRKGPGPGPQGAQPEHKAPDTTDFMANVPRWLRDIPAPDGTEYEVNCEALVIGAGPAGTTAVLKLAEAGVDVMCVESQSWEKFSVYPMDMAVYNSRFFLDKGTPEYDPVDIMNEYMNKALGHAHPQLIRDYAFRSGEMFDWLISHVPEDIVKTYAHAVNYKGNPKFTGEVCGQKNFIGTVTWRDPWEARGVFGYITRLLLMAAQDAGARFMFKTKGVRVLQGEDGTVKGALCIDEEGKQFIVNCKAVIVCAGDFGGNRDMLIDLSDQMRNLAWSFGLDRSDPRSVMPMGRDGSGIKMCLWAGGTMEAGPRAAQSVQMNKRPEFAFGGCWPTFGPDGRRFMNESLIRKGAYAPCDMLPIGGMITMVTDMNWEEYLDHQGYGHEMFDRSNDAHVAKVREDMSRVKTGPEGFEVTDFARAGNSTTTCYAADTLEELAEILGYKGEEINNFVEAVARYNEMCDKGRDEDWGCDPGYLFPIRKPPFLGCSWKIRLSPMVRGGLVQHGGVCTDGKYNVVWPDKTPIHGLYAAGNTCGQRYAVQYHTPTAGNSAGTALTSGYCAAERMLEYLGKF